MRASFVFLATLVACSREERRFSDDPPPRSFEGNAWAMAEGARLYGQMNCVGCHANGGGGIGPALRDGKWLYGSTGGDIYMSIAEGRPNGMPRFDRHLTPAQMWELVGYVRSLSGLEPAIAAPGRNDHMALVGPPSRQAPLPPVKATP